MDYFLWMLKIYPVSFIFKQPQSRKFWGLKQETNTACSPWLSIHSLLGCQQLWISEGKLGWNRDIWSDNCCIVFLQRLFKSLCSMQPKCPSHTKKPHIWSAKWPLTSERSALWLQGMRRESIYDLLTIISKEIRFISSLQAIFEIKLKHLEL